LFESTNPAEDLFMWTERAGLALEREGTMATPIPTGFHSITPHLVIKGAAEAIEFYKQAFGAEETCRIPFPGPNGQMKLGHAELKIGDSMLFLADEFPEQGVTGPNGQSPVTIHLYVSDVDAVFNSAVEAGATTSMPPTDMFWGDRYGKLVDPFGHHWAVATHVDDVTPEQMKERMAAMFGGAACNAE
jgi:PhnB protein